MKTERRHELQTNYLADWLGKRIEIVRPYSKMIGGVAVVLVAAGGIYAVISHSQGSHDSEAWQEYFSAAAKSDPEVLIKVGDRYDATEAGLWAFQSAADLQYILGSQQLFRDLATAKEDLGQARDNYQRVLDRAPNGSMLAARAQFGLAQTLEALGDVEGARRHYKAVADGNNGIAQSGAERLAELENPKVKNWYNWFADARRPAPTTNPLGDPNRPGLPGSLPGLNDPLSDRPDFLNNLPDVDDPLGLGDSRKSPGDAASGTTDDKEKDKEKTGPDDNSFDPTQAGPGTSPPGESKPPGDAAGDTPPPAPATPPAGDTPPKTGPDNPGTPPPGTAGDQQPPPGDSSSSGSVPDPS